MTLKMEKFYTDEISEQDTANNKTLPNLFDYDGGDFWKYFAISAAIVHPLIVFIIWGIFTILLFLGIRHPLLSMPELKNRDIEFVLTQKEDTPIDKNTRYRSDKNSRAGGIHDPKRPVSLPDPAPAPKAVQKSVPQASAPAQQKAQTPPKNVSQPQKTQAQVQPKEISKPSKAMAPVQRPVMKPSTSMPKPQMPKTVSAPQSPFKIAVPNTGAPVGKGFSTSGGTSSTGGSTSAGGTGKATGGMAMPAPQFSTARTGSSSSGGSKGGTGGSGMGGYGTGNMGNPGPGNPNGAPGIDAIKAPQWGPYMRDLEARIKRNWNPPKEDQSKRVVLLFKIGRNGELLSVKVVKPSSSPANDQAAISAVQKSAPFKPLPIEHRESSVEINFTFDYNVLGASKYR